MFQVFQMQKGESSDEYVLGEASVSDESQKVRRRNRVLQSCISCHQLRRKCDRQRPCKRCADQGIGSQCVYQLEDPATRGGPEQDELTRLRARVVELEHTVRVLMQRPISQSAMEALGLEIDENTLVLRKSRKEPELEGQGREKNRKISKVKAEDTRQSPGMPGMSGPNYSGSPSHCGCAHNPTGRESYAYLLKRIGDTLQTLKGLPEHQQGVACFVMLRLSEAFESIGNTVQSSAATPFGHPTSTPLPSNYTPAYPASFSPTSSSPPANQHLMSASHSSAYQQASSAPSAAQSHAYHQHQHQQPTIQQPTYPYPYTSSSSHSPSSSAGTMGSGQHMPRQAHQTAQGANHRGSGIPSISQNYSSLTSWDSMSQSTSITSRYSIRQGGSKAPVGHYDPSYSSRGDGGR